MAKNFDDDGTKAFATGALVGHLTVRGVNVEIQADSDGDYKQDVLVHLPEPMGKMTGLYVRVVGVEIDD